VLDAQDGSAMSDMKNVANRGDSAPNSHNDTAFTINLEDAKIIQECTHEFLINEKAKIREIGLNYFVNSFEDSNTSGEVVHLRNDITGINIWMCCFMISKWISD
ncbi:hypothetical protein PCYB_003150, partial [Plasmodium cynomolgi strain B]